MASLSEPVNKASSLLFENILRVCCDKLIEEGFSKKSAHSISVLITAAIEGGIMLCLAQKSSEPLKIVSAALPNLIKEL
jgi:TetR/AcrR family transcriptional regulator, lmrAB and yxaGH operons repressor